MKKILIFLFFLLFNFSTLNAENLVYKRINFYFYNMDGEKITGKQIFSDKKFHLFWFYDDYCPYTIKSLLELNRFLAYINYYYPDLVKFSFVEALNRSKREILYFQDKFKYYDYKFYLSPGMNTNSYLNVDRTPTLIIMDPYGNIVDKIPNRVFAIVYIKHLDYIIGKYCQANPSVCNLDVSPEKLINGNFDFYNERLKEAIENN